MNRALVAKVNVFADGKALRVLIREDSGSSSLGFADDVHGPWIIQETIVDAAGIPCVHAE